MHELLSNVPLIIDFPLATEPGEAFFQTALEQNHTRFVQAQQIAKIIAKILAQNDYPNDESTFAAISESCVILSGSFNDVESWANQYGEGEPYWHFFLHHGEAIPQLPNHFPEPVFSCVDTPAHTPSGPPITNFFDTLESKPKEAAKAPVKPITIQEYLNSLHRLFHRVNYQSINKIIQEFMSEVEEDSFYCDPEQRKTIATALTAIQ